jgi:hypothetical protein
MVGAATGRNLLSRDSSPVVSSLQESRLNVFTLSRYGLSGSFMPSCRLDRVVGGQFLRVSRRTQSYVIELCICHPNALSAVGSMAG